MPASTTQLAAMLRAGDVSAVEIARAAIDRAETHRAAFGGVAALAPERSLAAARESDARLAAGTARALEGVPITVKDWIDVAGWPVGGHPVDPDRRPTADATAVARLRAAGAVVIAISAAHADNAVHGPTRNPHDATRAPGGSSAGAAALVAAGVVPLALGSDSGGSIRLPAAWCGVAGLKPSFGRVPLTGHVPRAAALSDGRTVIGPIAATVGDLAVALGIIAGPDGLDAGVAPVPLLDESAVDPRVLVVGRVQGDASAPVAAAAVALSAAGATVVDDAVPDTRTEALALTRRYWTRARLSGSENEQLLWDWDRYQRRALQTMVGYDALIMPAADGAAPPWRESIDTDFIWTLPWSLTGSPAVVVPVGGDGGLPLAVQIVARRWDDHIALAAARLIEQGMA
jgi:amidase